jgi:hypothetical protein
MVRIVGVLAVLVIVVALVMGIVQRQFQPTTELPGKFRGRVLAMEFVSNTSDIDKILAPNVAYNRDVMLKVLTIDFVWIVCYGLLYATISVLLMRRNCPWAGYLGFLALIAGLATAAFDVRENVKIIQAMTHFPYEQAIVNSVNDAALLKWAFGFVAIALLAIAFQDLESRLARWISISFIVTAAIGFVGLWRPPLLSLVQIPLLIGLILLIIAAFAWPNALKESAC